jgi:hypothetical protein
MVALDDIAQLFGEEVWTPTRSGPLPAFRCRFGGSNDIWTTYESANGRRGKSHVGTCPGKSRYACDQGWNSNRPIDRLSGILLPPNLKFDTEIIGNLLGFSRKIG